MNNQKVNIRVYKRDADGTVLIWNTHPLTPEQRQQLAVLVRMEDAQDFKVVETKPSDTSKMQRVLDASTDTITIKHADGLDENTAFTVRLEFGQNADKKEASMDVERRGEHTGFAKVIRYRMPNGRVIYAMPAVIVGDLRDQLGKREE